VLRLDVDHHAQPAGAPGALFTDTTAAVLNPAFRRLVHDDKQPAPTREPEPFPVTKHDHRTILLAETTPPGHLYLHEIVEDQAGKISIQFPGDTAPTTYRVEGWMPNDTTASSSRVSFYDRIALRPKLGQWQAWRFVNTTGDTHPMHIHQSQFQPLNPAGTRLVITDAGGTNLYNPETRTTSAPLVPISKTRRELSNPAKSTAGTTSSESTPATSSKSPSGSTSRAATSTTATSSNTKTPR
jgi:spore coat protein A